MTHQRASRPSTEARIQRGATSHGALDPLLLLNNLPDPVCVLNGNGDVIFENSRSAAVFGSMLNRDMRRILKELGVERPDAFLKSMKDFVRGETDTYLRWFRTRGEDGKLRHFEARGQRFTLPRSGERVAALIAREIEPAGYSTHFLESSYNKKAYWNWRHDFHTRRTSWPEEMCKIVGIAPEKGVGMTPDQVRAFLHPRDRYVMRNLYRRSQEDPSPIIFHSRLRMADGGYLNCLTHGFIERDARGEPSGFVAFSCDITKEVEADRMLRENELQLRQLFEQVSDFVSLRDGDGKFLYASPACRRMFGYEPSMLVGTSAASITHPDDAEHVVRATKALTVESEAATLTFRVRCSDGRYVWVEAKMRCLEDGPDGPARIATISRDVTDRKRAEEALAGARERAEHANAVKSRFLANMSHELRTPLNAIIGFSDIIHRELFGPVGAARYKDYARLIQESGAHLLDLINDVLDMSKIEAGKFEMRFEELDLAELVQSCMKLMEPHALRSKLTLQADLGKNRRMVRGDRRALKQILLNLMTNAIKFTPASGIVTVSLENLTDGVALQVCDTGIGIPPDDIPRVTQPFEQVTSDPMVAQSGSGLGLALVQSLVNLHMGRLKIDSVQGQGTVVSVFLPFDPRSRRAT